MSKNIHLFLGWFCQVRKICVLSALRECLSIGRQVMASPHRSEEQIEWDAEEFRSGRMKKKPSWARTKVEAAFWVILSIFAISACDLKTVLLYDDRLHRWALNISYWCICVNGGILMYLNLYVFARKFFIRIRSPRSSIAWSRPPSRACSSHAVRCRYLKLLCGVGDDWLETAPRTIKLATALGIISGVTLTYSLWPVFGIVTVPLLFVLLLGFIEVWHFIPTP